MKYLILILLFVDFSYAGVRTVGKGKGGGYAEMQAILINEQMPLWANICLKPSSCGLSVEEFKILSNAAQAPFVISANSECTEPVIQIQNENTAMIASCALYKEGSAVAQDFSVIAHWVLTARLMTTQGLGLKSAQDIATKVFQNYQQTETRLEVVLSESTALAHFLQIQRDKNVYNILSIEGKSFAINLTPKVQELLTCETGSVRLWNLNFLGSQELDSARGIVESEVAWQCTDTKSYRASLQLFFDLSQTEIVAESIVLKLFRRTSF